MNSKTIVIYKSKYGSTKKYAEWIAAELSADLRSRSEVKVDDLNNYDTIIYGGSLHAVGISGLELIKENLNSFNNKKIIVFSVGAAPIKEETINAVVEANFGPEERSKIKFFAMRGAFNYGKLNLVDKTLMFLLKLKLKSKKPEDLNDDNRGLLESYEKPADFTDKASIIPLVKYALSGL
jgi:menaquinone-dependent protoporphyrinogen IX oxidase